MRPRPSIAAVLAFVVCAGPAGLARQSAQSDYRSMVEEYRGGRRSALDRIGAADAREVNAWIELARSAGNGAWDSERYLLTSSPRDVAQGGWHSLDVKLKNRGGQVRARRGYLR